MPKRRGAACACRVGACAEGRGVGVRSAVDFARASSGFVFDRWRDGTYLIKIGTRPARKVVMIR